MISRLIEVIFEVYRCDGKANARSFDSGFCTPRTKTGFLGAPRFRAPETRGSPPPLRTT